MYQPTYGHDEARYIDPRIAFAGGVFSDPTDDTGAVTSPGSTLDLTLDIEQLSKLPQDPKEEHELTSDHHSSGQRSYPSPAGSVLNPKAVEFRPGRPFLAVNTTFGHGQTSRRKSSAAVRTPRIKLSPAIGPSEEIACGRGGRADRGRQRSTASRRSSPNGRSVSPIRKGGQPRVLSPNNCMLLTDLNLPVETSPRSPADWVTGNAYNVGDHLAQIHNPEQLQPSIPPADYPAAHSASVPTAPSTSSVNSASGYRCKFEGCSQAHRTWDTGADLRHHEQKHYRHLWRYSCPECNEPFRWPKDLRRHIESHNRGEKNHNCTLCSKGYARADGLKKHMLKIHGQLPPTSTPLSSFMTSPSPTVASPSPSVTSAMGRLDVDTVPSTPMSVGQGYDAYPLMPFPIEHIQSTSAKDHIATQCRDIDTTSNPWMPTARPPDVYASSSSVSNERRFYLPATAPRPAPPWPSSTAMAKSNSSFT